MPGHGKGGRGKDGKGKRRCQERRNKKMSRYAPDIGSSKDKKRNNWMFRELGEGTRRFGIGQKDARKKKKEKQVGTGEGSS